MSASCRAATAAASRAAALAPVATWAVGMHPVGGRPRSPGAVQALGQAPLLPGLPAPSVRPVAARGPAAAAATVAARRPVAMLVLRRWLERRAPLLLLLLLLLPRKLLELQQRSVGTPKGAVERTENDQNRPDFRQKCALRHADAVGMNCCLLCAALAGPRDSAACICTRTTSTGALPWHRKEESVGEPWADQPQATPTFSCSPAGCTVGTESHRKATETHRLYLFMARLCGDEDQGRATKLGAPWWLALVLFLEQQKTK